MTALERWESFYVIVGSSAGALIGLQFVVMTLIAERPVAQKDAKAGAAFATPNVIHFGAVLFLSAMLSAPWDGLVAVAILCGLVGVGGLLYAAVVVRRMRSQATYQPVLEDWLFHVLLPAFAYALLLASAFVTYAHARAAMFGVGAAAVLLLFIGIHNAWDTVLYHVFVRREQPKTHQEER
jgi:hypothetical protein